MSYDRYMASLQIAYLVSMIHVRFKLVYHEDGLLLQYSPSHVGKHVSHRNSHVGVLG